MDHNSGTDRHHQEVSAATNKSKAVATTVERKSRPKPEHKVECPRCKSANTKFCYYNNYSMSQPRYFCKACRRYWTHGGSLRYVPIGGGCRKNSRRSSDAISRLAVLPEPMVPPPTCVGFPSIFPTLASSSFELPASGGRHHLSLGGLVPSSATGGMATSSFLDVLRGGAGGTVLEYGGTSGMVQMPMLPSYLGAPMLHGVGNHSIGASRPEEGLLGGGGGMKTMMGSLQWQQQASHLGGVEGSRPPHQQQVSNVIPSTIMMMNTNDTGYGSWNNNNEGWHSLVNNNNNNTTDSSG